MDLLKKNTDEPLLGKKIIYDVEMRDRNEVLKQLNENVVYRLAREQETEAGLYPDHFDPRFIHRLLNKTEFADTISPPFALNDNPCTGLDEFEITPVQKFVSSFLHPTTPYNGMLLYHGVGVGKTCAAILTAEGYLEQFPFKKVIIIAPRNIQPGFYRTIFDPTKLKIGKGEEPNTISGCTGSTYLHLTNSLFIRDQAKIERDVMKAIKKRYSFFGYLQFANYIRGIIIKLGQTADKKVDDTKLAAAIRREFNYRLMIVDEAHNLRDIDGVAPEEDNDTIEAEVSESKAGKLLTPQLRNVLKYSEGMKLMLMTATPMFNSVREISFLISLLLMNDKKNLLNDSELFNRNGTLKQEAIPLLGKYASAYVSFMRGENPNSFPLRLKPRSFPNLTISPVEGKETYPAYPPFYLTGELPVNETFTRNKDEYKNIQGMLSLPFQISKLQGFSEIIVKELTSSKATASINFTVLDSLLQAGNVVFPKPDESNNNTSTNTNMDSPEQYVGGAGFEMTFAKAGNKVKSRNGAAWLSLENLGSYSPKCASIIRLINNCKGVAFVYSRFVRSGALFLALALEANGYTGWNTNLLVDGIQSPGGRQCALCIGKEKGHTGDHKFVPAKYVLLTGEAELSPNNAKAIDAERSSTNIYGSQVKIVLGSQIAAEGLDLKFVREVHILDPWFHLNKTEQIVGRGIRFCSHTAIPDNRQHNTTVYLHVNMFSEDKVETADLYSYRQAYRKALQIGQVSRVLKQYAIDCNLRKPATVIITNETRQVIDSQGEDRGEQNLSDVAYSPLCDWLPDCDYTCIPSIPVEQITGIDNNTYNQFTARFRESMIKKQIQAMFKDEAAWRADGFEEIIKQQTGAPELAVTIVLRSIIGNRSFIIQNNSQSGYISLRNGYYVFQPLLYKDKNLPAAVRIADLPIKRDVYTPSVITATMKLNIEDEAVEAEEARALPSLKIRQISLWSILSNWIRQLSEEKVDKITEVVRTNVKNATENNATEQKVWFDRLSIVVYFMQIDDLDKDTVKQIMLEYIWDTFLSRKEQIKSLENPDEIMRKIGKEILLQSGAIKAMRFLNNDSGTLEYFCNDGKPCSLAVIDAFETDGDLVRTQNADVRHAGNPYGFLAAKRGKQVFKIQLPHPVGGKPDRGQECGYDSAPKDKREKLVILGKALPLKELKEGNLIQTVELKNSACHCTFLELILRYMNSKKVNSKVWFFRSVASFYAGHKFLASTGAKKAKPVVKSSIKEVIDPLKSAIQPTARKVVFPKPDEVVTQPTARKVVFPTEDDEEEQVVTQPTARKVVFPIPEEKEENEEEEEEEEEEEDDEVVTQPPKPEVEVEDNNNEIKFVGTVKAKVNTSASTNTSANTSANTNTSAATNNSKYKGNWEHEGVKYRREGYNIFANNGNYVGVYDPDTNEINTSDVFTD